MSIGHIERVRAFAHEMNAKISATDIFIALAFQFYFYAKRKKFVHFFHSLLVRSVRNMNTSFVCVCVWSSENKSCHLDAYK